MIDLEAIVSEANSNLFGIPQGALVPPEEVMLARAVAIAVLHAVDNAPHDKSCEASTYDSWCACTDRYIEAQIKAALEESDDRP